METKSRAERGLFATPNEALHARVVLNNVDFLRFFCATIVFLSHITSFFDISSVSYLHGLDEVTKRQSPIVSAGQLVFCGPAAVMMFFVISGICIHAPNRNKTHLGFLEFYTRRFVRIGIPLAGAYAIKVLVIGGSSFGPLPVWSLWCEMIYYLAYPILMLAILRFGFAGVFSVSLLGAAILVSTPDSHHGQAWTYGTALTWILFLPTWLLGVLIADNLHNTAKVPRIFRRVSGIFLLAGAVFAASVLCTVLMFHFHSIIKYKTSMLVFSFPAAWLIFVLLLRDFSASPVMRFLERQGIWSYSLYLMHPIGVVLAVKILQLFGVEKFTPLTSLVITLLVLICGFATALGFFHLCEKPSHLLAKWLGSRAAKLKILRIKLA